MDKSIPVDKMIIDAYADAGENYLAFRLLPVFQEIKTEQDRILHNEMIAEINLMIGDKPIGFLRSIADVFLREKFEPRKRFLVLVANRIMDFASRKGTNNG